MSSKNYPERSQSKIECTLKFSFKDDYFERLNHQIQFQNAATLPFLQTSKTQRANHRV